MGANFAELYVAMCAADVAGDHEAAGRMAGKAASVDRRNDAAARNRANLGPDTARERNARLVGRPRGPMGEAS